MNHGCLFFLLMGFLNLADLGLAQGGAFLPTCDRIPLVRESFASRGFTHTANEMLSILGGHHTASDLLISYGQHAFVSGQFHYGVLRKGLKDESVELWLDDCGSSLRYLGQRRTDEKGHVTHMIPGYFLRVGMFRVHQRVVGDNTWVTSTLRVVRRGADVLIFDIDGTINTDESSFSYKLFNPFYYPEVRAGAAAYIRFYYQRGFEIVYLSGRPSRIIDRTRAWLRSESFAPGTVIHMLVAPDVFGSLFRTEEYKFREVMQLQRSGMRIVAAYGDQKADILAYLRAGIKPQQIIPIGSKLQPPILSVVQPAYR